MKWKTCWRCDREGTRGFVFMGSRLGVDRWECTRMLSCMDRERRRKPCQFCGAKVADHDKRLHDEIEHRGGGVSVD